jgi:hypothetical protein
MFADAIPHRGQLVLDFGPPFQPAQQHPRRLDGRQSVAAGLAPQPSIARRPPRADPAQVIPSWNGDSVGHYEDDTLVIDTVGVKDGPFPIPIADLYAMVDLFGTPHTPALHVVERYRLLDHDGATLTQIGTPSHLSSHIRICARQSAT